MKLVLNLSKLLEKGAITPSEAERYTCLSQENTPNYISDALIGLGFVLISYGFMAFYIDAPESGAIAGLFIGLAHIGLGFLLKSDRILLTTICFVFGILLVTLSTLEFIFGS